MNIDIVNILNKVFLTCDKISSHFLFQNIEYSLKDVIVYDLVKFIELISTANSEERVQNFINEYLNGKQVNVIEIPTSISPKSIVLFNRYDQKNDTNTSEDIKNLFTVIGKNYLLSRFDRADINRDAFLNYISQINHYIDSSKQIIKITTCDKNEKVDKLLSIETDKKSEEGIEPDEEKNLQELLDELNSLIGLEKVKHEVKKRINQIQVDKKREQVGLKKSSMSLHLVFTGNPGTGKTIVARKLAAIYKQLGVLSKGQFIEVDRSSLVGGYVGSTAIKTQEVIDKAIGGILFIDEAYTLTHGKGDTDFGQEAVDTLLKAMEDKRDNFIVIVAGYPDEMHEFIKSNPGLQSRFNKYIEFEDYTANELYEIFNLICKNDEKIIHEECKEYLKQHFVDMLANKTSNFANGRTVRNYFEEVIENLNERLVLDLDNASNEDLQTIRLVDLNI